MENIIDDALNDVVQPVVNAVVNVLMPALQVVIKDLLKVISELVDALANTVFAGILNDLPDPTKALENLFGLSKIELLTNRTLLETFVFAEAIIEEGVYLLGGELGGVVQRVEELFLRSAASIKSGYEAMSGHVQGLKNDVAIIRYMATGTGNGFLAITEPIIHQLEDASREISGRLDICRNDVARVLRSLNLESRRGVIEGDIRTLSNVISTEAYRVKGVLLGQISRVKEAVGAVSAKALSDLSSRAAETRNYARTRTDAAIARIENAQRRVGEGAVAVARGANVKVDRELHQNAALVRSGADAITGVLLISLIGVSLFVVLKLLKG